MIQSIETLIVALATTTILSVALLFLPAIIELKKPKDAGPRLITDSFAQIRLSALKTALLNIEEELKFDSQLVSKIGSFLGFIPNLEA
jgi:hypothetical protein